MQLIVIYGPPLVGKTTVARQLARTLPDKSAVVSIDHLLNSIGVSDADELVEIDFVHGQVKLLVANYLKNRYSVIVEGPYAFERDGRLRNYEREIDNLLNLMRMLAVRTAIVRLTASEDVLARRAREAGRASELDAALRIDASYLRRQGFHTFDTGSRGPVDIARNLLRELERE